MNRVEMLKRNPSFSRFNAETEGWVFGLETDAIDT